MTACTPCDIAQAPLGPARLGRGVMALNLPAQAQHSLRRSPPHLSARPPHSSRAPGEPESVVPRRTAMLPALHQLTQSALFPMEYTLNQYRDPYSVYSIPMYPLNSWRLGLFGTRQPSGATGLPAAQRHLRHCGKVVASSQDLVLSAGLWRLSFINEKIHSTLDN